MYKTPLPLYHFYNLHISMMQYQDAYYLDCRHPINKYNHYYL